MKTGTGGYRLEDLHKGIVTRTWNAEKIKKYYTWRANLANQL